jgi:putative flippase GtrA
VTVVGTVAFLVTGGGAFLLHVFAGAGPLTSSAVAIAMATALSYAGNRCWTFRHHQHIAIRRDSIRYVTLQGTGLAVQLSCVALTAFVLRQHGAPSYGASLVIGTGLSAAIRFWSCREWVWPARHRVPAAARSLPG